MEEQRQGRGRHLTLDPTGIKNVDALKDLSFIYDLLRGLPEKIGMHPISPPFVMKYLEPPDPEWGLTGMVFISTSHISIHTFPEKRTFSFDAFSCKGFDCEGLVGFLRQVFMWDHCDLHDVRRRCG